MDSTYVVKNSSTISSPALLLYLEKLHKNTSSLSWAVVSIQIFENVA